MPGTQIRERTAKVARSLPTSTGTLFLAGTASRGTDDIVQNLDDFVAKFGDRASYSLAYDMVEAYFRTGGRILYFSRIMGPNPVYATITLVDGAAAISLYVVAASPGSWANTRNVAVIAGDNGGFKLVITDDTDTSINETTPSFATQAEAITWFETHDDLRLTLGVSTNNPAVVAARSLATGTDDRANATDATRAVALTKFGKKLGPGQVAFAGYATATSKGQLADHAAANNRVALFDVTDTAVKATLLAEGVEVNALSNGKHGATFGPWVNIPALSGGGSARAIPASAVVAGVIAASDASGHTANEPAAGINGIVPWIVSLRATFSDDDADDINDGSVNLLRDIAGDYRVYGYRSGVTKAADPDWWQFGNVRLYMEIAAKADVILERFVLKQIDGRGILFSTLQGLLTAMLLPYWESGALYGEDPGDAFYVDTGSSVNTGGSDGTIANGEIHAVIELTMSSMGESVILDIVKNRIGG